MTRSAFLISHTHWDREWYRTFQQFRLDLVRTIDGVLDTLERDPAFAHFLLDGQTIALDDYLAMRPERADDLRRQIAAGRLGVGPWYCHPDLFLVSGEALVRNLMLGLRMARSYGRATAVGYVPDQFGHTGQFPQILHGFGITSAVPWRGVDARATRNESWWEAPDGSRVMLELLPQSYSNAQRLPLDPPVLAGRLRQLCEALTSSATGAGVLLMNGGDHLPIQAGLPEALAEANRLLAPDWAVRQVSLDEAVRLLGVEGRPEGVLRGELRSPATAHLLPGVLSTRTYLKRRNVLAQQLLEREAEPYAVWAATLGAPYPHGELWEAWRLLLQNQPHDSICGCSIDQVHREMGTRYDGVEQIGEDLVARALGYIAARVDTRLPSADDADDAAPADATGVVPLVVVNPGDAARAERMTLTLQLPGMAAGYKLLDAAGAPVPHAWRSEAEGEPSTIMPVPREEIPDPAVVMALVDGNRVMGMGLQGVATRADDDGLHVEVTVGDSGIMSREEIEAEIMRVDAVLTETAPTPVTLHVHRNARHDLELLARDVPAHGYRTLWLRPLDAAYLAAPDTADAANARPDVGLSDPYTIETDDLAVVADRATGALSVTDKRADATYGPCNVFVDDGDAGDSYTYAAPSGDSIVVGPAAPPTIVAERDALGARLRIAQELVVPAGLAKDRTARSNTTATLRVTSVVTLTHGSPRVDIATTIDNTAEDHRLRVTFRAPFAVDHIHVEQAYDVVERPLGARTTEGGTMSAGDALEDPVSTAPQHGFTLLHDKQTGHGLALTNVGLPEYEASASDDGTTTLTLTLLRCVGWLSRDDLPTRRGGAGPSLPTPEAQCPGRQTFSYGLIPFAGARRDAVLLAHDAHLPLRAVAAEPTAGPLPSSGSFLTVDAPGVVVGALKGAEDGNGLVVRLYNATDQDAVGTLTLTELLARVERLALDESLLDAVPLPGSPTNDTPIRLGPHKIETLRLVPRQARQ